MRAPGPAIVVACVFVCAVTSTSLGIAHTPERLRVKSIAWDDVAPLHARLEAQGITPAAFPGFVGRTRRANAVRVREGDLDHLVFYVLQSTRFTDTPPIEPALSAKALVESLDDKERDEFLHARRPAPVSRIPASVRSRVAALVRALDSSSSEPRLAYFRGLVTAAFPDARQREARLFDEYLRVMRFVYEKEFVAQRSERGAAAVAELYRSRGLSTDTAVEAGFLVYVGLGVVKALEPDRRIRRVLIVGPGLDLAPRTALLEVGPPESYQPWAIIDALLALGLAETGSLDVVAADVNPRVVSHLRRPRGEPPTLTLVSEIRDSETTTLSDAYRSYFGSLGRAVGQVQANGAVGGGASGHLHKSVRVGVEAARALRAERLDIVTEHLEGQSFDLVVATNVLPYFDDVALMLALSNVSRMLAPGGVFLHNEARPVVRDVTAAVGLPFEQSRHVTIAAVRGSPTPLYDSVFVHRRRR